MVKRLIGTETTGTDGSCNIPYIGTGAGIINIEVETTINGTTITTPLTLLDCIFYDKGTSEHYNTNWTNQNNAINVARSSTETTLTQAITDTTGFYINELNFNSCIIDFDYYCNVQNEVVSIRKVGTVLRWLYLSDWNVAANTWCHVKFEINETSLKISVNDVERSYTLTNIPDRFVFRVQNNQEIKYKNFKIY